MSGNVLMIQNLDVKVVESCAACNFYYFISNCWN